MEHTFVKIIRVERYAARIRDFKVESREINLWSVNLRLKGCEIPWFHDFVMLYSDLCRSRSKSLWYKWIYFFIWYKLVQSWYAGRENNITFCVLVNTCVGTWTCRCAFTLTSRFCESVIFWITPELKTYPSGSQNVNEYTNDAVVIVLNTRCTPWVADWNSFPLNESLSCSSGLSLSELCV